MTLTLWLVLRAAVGAPLGMFALWALDEGLWNEALLKGAMIPPPTPEKRFAFLIACALAPEYPIAGFLTMLARRL